MDPNPLIIMGDFNLPDLKWPLDDVDTDKYNTLHANFLDMFVNSNLNQLVTEITRKRNSEESLLDLIMCNEENLCTKVQYYPNIGKSDHLVLLATLQIELKSNRRTCTQQVRRNFFKADFQEIMNTINTSDCTDTVNIDEAWKQFRSKSHTAIEAHVPLSTKNKKINVNKPWITKQVLEQVENKLKLWKEYKSNGCEKSYKAYRTENNKLVTLVRKLRAEFERGVVNCGPKSFYSYIRKQLSSEVSVPPSLRDEKGDITNDQKVVAELFADQFEKSFVREPAHMDIPDVQMPRVENSIESVCFTPGNVAKTLATFSDSTSMGPDTLPSIFLKKCSSVLVHELAYIMNLSLKNGTLPRDWKEAHVTPIYKKGDKFVAANYRPISLTSIVCKTMEKIIVTELRNFISKENVIINEQHGFIPKRSTVTNLLVCLDKWTRDWDNRQPTDVIYLDYEKAFDRVPIRRLIAKLEHFGIRGQLLEWISDFLTHRIFKVRVGETL
ncbi:uncharacterized protein LOC134750819 [Cydia strobilella]|uniref:uncharacterized protein LOC134750819 n=1 Tax=Cydia strobilella TaxID=1100964 RepID=UPI003007DCE1